MHYRSKTYIAADWDGDKEAINKLHEWNNSSFYALNFVDVHDIIQARDTSFPCSIKKSLSNRMDMCKTFVFIVGNETNSRQKGKCRYCSKYYYCHKSSDNKSFLEFEIDKAIRDGLRIVVLYNSSYIYRYTRCPEALRNRGEHVAMKNSIGWNYQEIKRAIMGY
ncbi:MAG TPA: molecular chaperone Tir [Firmicutes bacterium]|nr:molecular chaperone Tir [Bacillota bacterium]